jgi:hypothetical protein
MNWRLAAASLRLRNLQFNFRIVGTELRGFSKTTNLARARVTRGDR